MIYYLPVYYEVKGHIQVEADSIDDAITFAKNNLDKYPLPQNTDYVEDSFELEEEDIIKDQYEK